MDTTECHSRLSGFAERVCFWLLVHPESSGSAYFAIPKSCRVSFRFAGKCKRKISIASIVKCAAVVSTRWYWSWKSPKALPFTGTGPQGCGHSGTFLVVFALAPRRASKKVAQKKKETFTIGRIGFLRLCFRAKRRVCGQRFCLPGRRLGDRLRPKSPSLSAPSPNR